MHKFAPVILAAFTAGCVTATDAEVIDAPDIDPTATEADVNDPEVNDPEIDAECAHACEHGACCDLDG